MPNDHEFPIDNGGAGRFELPLQRPTQGDRNRGWGALVQEMEESMAEKSRKGLVGKQGSKARMVPGPVEALGTHRVVEAVNLADIDLEDTRFRFRVTLRVGDLVESIQNHGQQVPVILRRNPDRPGLQVVSGFRRIAAIRRIGWTTVNALVLENLSDEQAWKVSVLENEARKTYSDLDRGYAILAWQAMGMSLQEVAESVFHLSRKQASRLKSLVSLPAVLQEAIGADGFTTTHALVLKQLRDRFGARVDCQYWIERIRREGLSVSQTRAAVLRLVKEEQQEDPLEVFVYQKDQKTGRDCIRLRPVKIDASRLTESQITNIIKDLDEIRATLEGSAKARGTEAG